MEDILLRKRMLVRKMDATDDESNLSNAQLQNKKTDGYNTETVAVVRQPTEQPVAVSNEPKQKRIRSAENSKDKKFSKRFPSPPKRSKVPKKTSDVSKQFEKTNLQEFSQTIKNTAKTSTIPKNAFESTKINEFPLTNASSSSDSESESEKVRQRIRQKQSKLSAKTKGLLDEGKIIFNNPKPYTPIKPKELDELQASLPPWFAKVKRDTLRDMINFLKKMRAKQQALRENKAYVFLERVSGFLSKEPYELFDNQLIKPALGSSAEATLAALEKLEKSSVLTPVQSPEGEPDIFIAPFTPLTSKPNASKIPVSPDVREKLSDLVKDGVISIPDKEELQQMSYNEILLLWKSWLSELIDSQNNNENFNTNVVNAIANVNNELIKLANDPNRGEKMFDLLSVISKTEDEEYEATEQSFMEEETPQMITEGHIKSGAPPQRVVLVNSPTSEEILLNNLAEKDLLLSYMEEYYNKKVAAEQAEYLMLNDMNVINISSTLVSATERALTYVTTNFEALVDTVLEHYFVDPKVLTQMALLTSTFIKRAINETTTKEIKVINTRNNDATRRDCETFFSSCKFDGYKVFFVFPRSSNQYYSDDPYANRPTLYPRSSRTSYLNSGFLLPPVIEYR